MKLIVMVRELAAPDLVSGMGGLLQEPLLVGMLPTSVRGSGCAMACVLFGSFPPGCSGGCSR